MKKSKLKKVLRALFLSFTFSLIIILSLSSYYFYNKIFRNVVIKEISYSSKNDIKYKVYLFENDYFEEPFLDMGRTYISSLIDYIDIDLSNVTSFSEPLDGDYTYYINATMSANKLNTMSDNSYWSKTINLTEPVSVPIKHEDSFKINSNVKIDYQYYNQMLANFKREYGLSVDGNLKIELLVNSTGYGSSISGGVPVKTIAEVNIPLTQQVIDLSIDTSNNNQSNSFKESVVANNITIYSILFYIFINVSNIILIIFFIRLMILVFNIQSKYTKSLKKILSSYDSIIVNIRELPNTESLNVIEVNDFNELVDAHNEVRLPINYYEEVKNYKSVFMIVSSNIVWVYNLYNEEYKKKGNLK